MYIEKSGGGKGMVNVNETEFKEKANELFKEIEEKIKPLKESEAYRKGIMILIEEAKSLFKENKITESRDKYVEAMEKIRKSEISIDAEPLAWRLLKIEFAWLFLLLLLGYITYRWPNFALWKGIVNLHTQTAWFGSLGGITAALYGIYNHIQLRDFDPKFKFWYICKPIIGGIFGWFVYLIYFIGLISVQGTQGAEVKTPELPFVIAFLAGFSERFTIKIIDRLMSVLMTWEEKTPAEKPGQEKG